MIGNRKQSVTNDTDVQKGNVMAVETKQKDNLKNRLWLTGFNHHPLCFCLFFPIS